MINRARLRRWHIWLGWFVGIPMLLWTVSGIVMVAKPIEEVRGSHLLTEPGPMRFGAPVVPPRVENVPLRSLSLQPRAAGPRWVVTLADGTARLADPATGALQTPLGAADAVREVLARYTGEAGVSAVTRTDSGRPPPELRRPIAAWKVRMNDGTHFYVDAGSGEIVARRTSWWRFYDLMWGLHIMDPTGREDTHNPWIVSFALISVVTVILALVLLPLTIRRRRKNGAARAED